MAYRFTENGHECWPTKFGRYRMLPGWIDTDNECWEEPDHLRSADGPRVTPTPQDHGDRRWLHILRTIAAATQ